MRRIRDLLRLKYAQGLSERAIALSLGLGKGTVGGYLARARQAALSWPLPSELDDDSLELLLFPSPTMASRLERPMPDWATMDRELRRPGVTRALLWEEYRAQSPDGFGHAWFCEHFDAWKGRVRPTSHLRCAFSATRQTHVGGEKVFVDFAGDTIDVIDPATGKVRAMKLFVAASRQRRACGTTGACLRHDGGVELHLCRGGGVRRVGGLDPRSCSDVRLSGRRAKGGGS
jgi:transposase